MLYYLQYFLTSFFSFTIVSCYTIYKDLTDKNVRSNKLKNSGTNGLFEIYFKIVPQVLINFFLYTPFILSIFTLIIDLKSVSNYHMNFFTILTKILIMELMLDFFLYFFNRLFKTNSCYLQQKQTYELTAPIGIAVFYMKPFDYIFLILVPFYLPCFILVTNNLLVHLWTIILITQSMLMSHFGIRNSSESYNNYYKYNYGLLGFIYNKNKPID